jgi:hypothetical protein
MAQALTTIPGEIPRPAWLNGLTIKVTGDAPFFASTEVRGSLPFRVYLIVHPSVLAVRVKAKLA